MAFDWNGQGNSQDQFNQMRNRGGSSGFLGMFSDPSEEANQYIGQIPGQTQQYFDPYINSGKNALPQLQGQYDQLMNDPGGMVNKIGQGYHESPGFQFSLQKALAGGNRSFAAGGMGGSPASANWGMETAEGLANQDYQSYLKNALSQYGLGLGGEEKMADRGQKSGSDYASMIADTLAAQGKLKYEGAKSQNDWWGNMFGNAAKAYMGGGNV